MRILIIFMFFVAFIVSLRLFSLWWFDEARNNDQSTIENLERYSKVRKMFYSKKTVKKKSVNGFFLFGAGGIGGQESETIKKKVTFAFEYKGSYIFATIPLFKARIVLDKGAITPMVKFKLIGYPYYDINDSILNNKNFHHRIEYFYIKCQPKDWLIDITIPDGK